MLLAQAGHNGDHFLSIPGASRSAFRDAKQPARRLLTPGIRSKAALRIASPTMPTATPIPTPAPTPKPEPESACGVAVGDEDTIAVGAPEADVAEREKDEMDVSAAMKNSRSKSVGAGWSKVGPFGSLHAEPESSCPQHAHFFVALLYTTSAPSSPTPAARGSVRLHCEASMQLNERVQMPFAYRTLASGTSRPCSSDRCTTACNIHSDCRRYLRYRRSKSYRLDMCGRCSSSRRRPSRANCCRKGESPAFRFGPCRRTKCSSRTC